MAYKNFQNRPYQTSYRKKQYLNRKFQKNPPAEYRLLGGILSGIGNLILAPFRRRGISPVDRKVIVNKWYHVRELLSKKEESQLKSAVIEADKIMDFALKSARFPGNKFADRIRSARSRFPKKIYSGIWEAHILRNELVHNIDSKINSYRAKDAVNQIGNGLRYLKGL